LKSLQPGDSLTPDSFALAIIWLLVGFVDYPRDLLAVARNHDFLAGLYRLEQRRKPVLGLMNRDSLHILAKS